MNLAKEIVAACAHLFFPHVCAGCGTDLLGEDQWICMHCYHALPLTGFETLANNPMEKIFWGRVPVLAASCRYYFTRHSALQHLLHAFKYDGKKQFGNFFGREMGEALSQSGRFHSVDALVPLPLFASREKKRGYNQSAILCEGIAQHLQIPVLSGAVIRTLETETQTQKNRIHRWQNMSGKFKVIDKEVLQNKHILLVDDVLTTGATLDACAQALLQVENLRISMATLAYTLI